MADGVTVSTFGDLLREDRDRAGVSQTDLARAVQVSPALVCRWQKNERFPNIAQILRLMDALSVPPARVVAWTRQIPRYRSLTEVWAARGMTVLEIVGDLARRVREGAPEVASVS